MLVGSEAKELSASTVSCLKQVWAQEYRNWSNVIAWIRSALGLCLGRRCLQRPEGEQVKLAPGVIGVNERSENVFWRLKAVCGSLTKLARGIVEIEITRDGRA